MDIQKLYGQAIVRNIKPQTNADRVRAMTDEELAEWIVSVQQDIVDYYSCKKHVPELPVESKIWLDWLKQEAEE